MLHFHAKVFISDCVGVQFVNPTTAVKGGGTTATCDFFLQIRKHLPFLKYITLWKKLQNRRDCF